MTGCADCTPYSVFVRCGMLDVGVGCWMLDAGRGEDACIARREPTELLGLKNGTKGKGSR